MGRNYFLLNSISFKREIQTTLVDLINYLKLEMKLLTNKYELF
jgi:hypothetical protein